MLAPFDVVGLYPNIRYEEKIYIMGNFFNERSDTSISIDSSCSLVKTALKENYFKLGDEVFHKLLDTATRFASVCQLFNSWFRIKVICKQ